jgi:hypothetical protein
MSEMNLSPFTEIKEYFKTLTEATLKGSIKAKAWMLGGAIFIIGFYWFSFSVLGEVVELIDLQTRTGVIPSTVENLVMAFLFWAGHKYFYTKAKEEL